MWSELDNKSRIGLGISVVVLMVVTITALIWLLSSNQAALFSNMDEKEASNVILALEEMKVPYTLSDGGKNILVDEAVVEEVRLKLIGQGVSIQNGKGFELFDDADIGMTEYSQKINYLRAMQGELARSIMSIDGIKYARVHLVLSETSVFKQNKEKPTASVTVIPEAGVSLKNKQIVGIQRLLAAAAPGISEEDVTVLDNNGVTLSNTRHASEEEQITSILLQKKQEAESYLREKVNKVLDKTFGEGNTVATISVDLMLDKVHRKEEIVLPKKSKNDGLLRKRETNNGEKKENAKNENKSIELEYQISKRIEEIISMPGAIKRINVGVLVPENVNAEKIERLKSVISMAVGLNSDRGDNVVVYPMEIEVFDRVSEIQSPENNEKPSLLNKASEKISAKKDIVVNVTDKYIGYETLLFIAAIMGLMLIAMFIFLMKSLFSKKPDQLEMTSAEKDKLLAELKTWMNKGAV